MAHGSPEFDSVRRCTSPILSFCSGIIPVGLNKLDMAATAGDRDLHMHAASLSALIDMSIKDH